jgi:succinylarginine dihydrolase
MTPAYEVNFDGLVGPTHNYHALSWGNTASTTNLGEPSRPKAAALEGLEKMKRLHDLGVCQAVLPPQARPCLGPLRRLGFAGRDADVLRRAGREAPDLLGACYSASAMWAANSATVTPSADAADGKVQFTPANLLSKFHRTLEVDETAATLRAVFADRAHFRHHEPLPGTDLLGDEGAANHTRLCAEYGGPGLHLFVYGRDAQTPGRQPQTFPARQTRQASEAVHRQHAPARGRVLFSQQNPRAIDAGVFHNDVIATGDRDVFLYHESAYVDTPAVVARLAEAFEALTGKPLRLVGVTERELPLQLAVRSYLFNSQLVRAADGRTFLVAPAECRRMPRVRAYLAGLLARPRCPIDAVEFVDVNQSMRNGGGPACLRLRVVLTADQLRSLRGNVLFTDELYQRLRTAIQRTYPEQVTSADFTDPAFARQCRAAVARIRAALALDAAGDNDGAAGVRRAAPVVLRKD